MKVLSTLFVLMYLALNTLTAAELAVAKTTFAPGEAVTVTFSGSTLKNDWVGMYNSTTTPAESNNLAWFYLNGKKSTPSAVIPSGSLQFTAPTIPGDYKFCFHPSGGYTVDAVANFTVQAEVVKPQFTSTMTSLVEGDSTKFIDMSKNTPTAWSWSFEGGSPAISTEQNPTVTYANSGTYNVTLTTISATGSSTITKTGYVTVAKAGEPTHLKCLQFNVWQEGTSVTNGMTYIRDVVAAVNPDVVSFVEVRNYSGDWTTKIVDALAGLGLTYHRGYVDGDTSIISKFPIKSSKQFSTVGDHGSVVVSEVNVYGTEVVVGSIHLDYVSYACYLPRGYAGSGAAPYNGWGALSGGPVTDASIIKEQNLGSLRDEQIAEVIEYLKDDKRPTILLGDFNEPSHLDWTAKQANMFDHNGAVYQWDSTLALVNANFTDAFRKIYPDEVANPGITWPAIATGKPNTGWINADERDRIDFIFYRGAGTDSTDAAVVGPQACYVNGVKSTANTENDKFLVSDMPWPSDHKGMWANVLIPSGPKKTTCIPTNGANHVSPNSNLTLSFNMPVVPVAGKMIKISKSDGTLVENIDVSTLGSTAASSFVIDPNNELAFNITFNVEVESGAFKNTDGIEFRGIKGSDWSFTTQKSTTTPAFGLEMVLDGDTLRWTVDYEDGVQRYKVSMREGSNWVAVATVTATGDIQASYEVIVPKADAEYKVEAVESLGFPQIFVPTSSNKSTTVIELTKGWNLISVPAINAKCSNKQITFWLWEGGTYSTVTELKACQGVWVYSENAETLTITGDKLADGNVELTKGWNLVGPVENCQVASSFRVYTWHAASYTHLSQSGFCITGCGYWIFSDTATSIILK